MMKKTLLRAACYALLMMGAVLLLDAIFLGGAGYEPLGLRVAVPTALLTAICVFVAQTRTRLER